MEPNELITETVAEIPYTIEVYPDKDPFDPRKAFGNLGVMVCFHKRYSLGDYHDLETNMFHNWNEVLGYIQKHSGPVVALPLYLYDHSGITMNTYGFSHCDPGRWDWGQTGWIYVFCHTLRSEFGWKKVTPKRKAYAEQILLSEVESYSAYLEGAVYGYTVKDPDGSEIASCWGFYGYDHKKNGLIAHATEAVKHHLKLAA